MTEFIRRISSISVSRTLIFALLIFSVSSSFAQDGEKLYKTHCERCHYWNEKKLTGPGLKDVRTRWSSEANLVSWILNSPAFLATGDAYANDLFNKYNKVAMPAFPQLTKEDAVAILDYVDAKNAEVVVAPTGGATTDGGGSASTDDNSLLYILVAAAVVLSILIYSLYSMSSSLITVLKQRDGEDAVDDRSFLDRMTDGWACFVTWTKENRKMVGIGITIVILLVLKCAWDVMMGIGVYTNYQPHQPIKFSHKLHAGDNGIACVYCHTGVNDSRQATIPSPSTCMNCHKAVNEGPTTGKNEIAKIYASIGFDPNEGKYIDAYEHQPYEKVAEVYETWLGDADAYRQVQAYVQKPIAWTQVHKLPDHVYFNHAQHYRVGGIECETCHGPVKEMEEVYQYSPLTMGWCINCHRETKVKFDENPYYDKLHDYLSKRYKSGDQFTVARIGGLECGKCHY